MKEAWQIAEMKVAELFEGKVQPGSGCSIDSLHKRDVITKTQLIEVKFTQKDVCVVKRSCLEALVDQAAKLGKAPLIVCVFGKEFPWKILYAEARKLLDITKANSLRVKNTSRGKPWKTLWI